LERMVIQRDRQRDNADLISVALVSGEMLGCPAGVEVPELLPGDRGSEEGKCVICV